MTDNKKATKHFTTETNINVEGSSEIILECYKKNNKLKIRVISEGYDSELNVRFPRDLREEGALYSVETIEKTKGNYYLVKGNITKIDQDLDSVIAKNSDLNNEQNQTILTEEKTLKETTTPQDLTELANERAEASGETTTSERLKELANKSVELACLVAQNPHCSSDLLAELAHNEDRLIRQAVTNNPNTPKETLLELGSQFPEEFLDNPIFDLLLLENPNFLAEIPKSTLESIVKVEKFPQPFLTWVLNNSNDNDRLLMALLSNPNLTHEHLDKLSSHKNPLIAQEAKLHINWNGEIKNTEDEIKKALNKSALVVPKSKGNIFVKLYYRGMLKKWAEEPWAKSITFCLKDYEMFFYFSFDALKHVLISNPNIPSKLLGKLLEITKLLEKSSHKDKSDNIPLAKLDIYRDLCMKMLFQQLPGKKNWDRSRKKNWDGSLLGEILSHPETSAEVLEKIASDPDIPAEVLEKIASHPEIPAEVLEKILSHPKTPITVLEKLADNNDKRNIYKGLLQNPNTPASLLEKHIYPSCVDFLMEGTEPDLGRFIVFLSPYAKVSHLENNFRSESWLERWAIAQNPNTPDNTLSYLVQDGNRLVRSAAELNIKQRQKPQEIELIGFNEGWKLFCQWKKNNPDSPLAENLNLSELNRFAARYRLALSYEGIKLKDYAQDTIDAYGCLLGVFLAYSAFEQLFKAVGLTDIKGKLIVEEWAIKDKSIAEELRKNDKILNFLHDKVDSGTLKERIVKFQQGDDDNILVVAQAMRHLVAHGILTVHSGDIKPKTMIKICDLVKESVNNKSEYCFDHYVLNPIIVK